MVVVLQQSSCLCLFYQFENFASEVLSVSRSNVQNTLNAIEAFGASISSYAASTNSSWPYVTVEDFSARAQRVARLSQANWVIFLPEVEEEERDQWNAYVEQERIGIYED